MHALTFRRVPLTFHHISSSRSENDRLNASTHFQTATHAARRNLHLTGACTQYELEWKYTYSFILLSYERLKGFNLCRIFCGCLTTLCASFKLLAQALQNFATPLSRETTDRIWGIREFVRYSTDIYFHRIGPKSATTLTQRWHETARSAVNIWPARPGVVRDTT